MIGTYTIIAYTQVFRINMLLQSGQLDSGHQVLCRELSIGRLAKWPIGGIIQQYDFEII